MLPRFEEHTLVEGEEKCLGTRCEIHCPKHCQNFAWLKQSFRTILKVLKGKVCMRLFLPWLSRARSMVDRCVNCAKIESIFRVHKYDSIFSFNKGVENKKGVKKEWIFIVVDEWTLQSGCSGTDYLTFWVVLGILVLGVLSAVSFTSYHQMQVRNRGSLDVLLCVWSVSVNSTHLEIVCMCCLCVC